MYIIECKVLPIKLCFLFHAPKCSGNHQTHTNKKTPNPKLSKYQHCHSYLLGYSPPHIFFGSQIPEVRYTQSKTPNQSSMPCIWTGILGVFTNRFTSFLPGRTRTIHIYPDPNDQLRSPYSWIQSSTRIFRISLQNGYFMLFQTSCFTSKFQNMGISCNFIAISWVFIT